MRLWIKLVLGLAAVALMVWLVVRVGGWTLRFVTNSADSGETDPMFADEATAAPTIPPDLGGTEGVAEFHDNSANWDTSMAFDKIIACGGSWMVKDSFVKEGNFEEIRKLTAEAVSLVK